MKSGKPHTNDEPRADGSYKVSDEKMVVYLVVLQGPRVKGPAQKKFSYHTA